MSGTNNDPEGFLGQWKTSAGAVVGGVVVTIVLGQALGQVVNDTTSVSVAEVALFIGAVWGAVGAYYAFAVYPSLFSAFPKLTSNAGVSFLNGFFGSFIFGPLFCSNLTKGRKGISYIVLGVLEIAMALLYVYLLWSVATL